MALDGIVVASIVDELNKNILDGKIDKIYQPEKDEIVMSIRSNRKTYKLFLSSNAMNNRVCFTKESKFNPDTPPMFCMILRKYINGGKILKIEQINFDRIICITISSFNDFGDYTEKKLIIELMGKHSNIILTDDNNVVLDSIKRINIYKSTVRQILPNLEYTLPPNDKKNPFDISEKEFAELLITNEFEQVQSFLFKNFTGISKTISNTICSRTNVHIDTLCSTIVKDNVSNTLFNNLKEILKIVTDKSFEFYAYYQNNKLKDFSSYDVGNFYDNSNKFDNISDLLQFYYIKKDIELRLSQKSQDLKKLLQINIERCSKKISKHMYQLNVTEKREKYRLYGELITSNMYAINPGDKELVTNNFYSEAYEEITIPLDVNLTANENAQKYFKKYNKQKRGFEASKIQLKESRNELSYLESILNSINSCETEEDINEIREELFLQGYVKKKKTVKNKNKKAISKPYTYISSDGFEILVGKNNLQNDELTLRTAHKNDIWFHTKDIPGSHVIIKKEKKNIPNTTLEEAAHLAVYYSKSKNSSLVPVDYTEIKNVKKPSGAKPGMVIYKTNETAYITTSEEIINKIKRIDN